MKRVTAFLMAFVAVFYLSVECTPRVEAVAPIALVEAALLSYVASTGMQLWVDNGTGDDVLGLCSELYGDFVFAASGGALTLQQIADRGYIYNDVKGNIIISKTAADNFQAFCDWVKNNYSLQEGGNRYPVIVSQDDMSFPVNTSGSSSVSLETLYPARTFYPKLLAKLNYQVVDHANTPIDQFLIDHKDDIIYVVLGHSKISSPSWGGFQILAHSSFSPLTLGQSYSGWSKLQGKCTVSLAASDSDFNVITISQYSTSTVSSICPYGLTTENNNMIASNYNVGMESTPGLAVSLAQDIFDRASGLLDSDSLVLDVGAAAGSSILDVVQAVLDGYSVQTGTLPVVDTVVATEVIDTPVYDYPDVDNLGLPELGLALVERFPFCIPYDFVHLVQLFDAEPVAPYIVIDIFPSSFKQRVGITGNTSFTLDMSREEYATLGVIMRWGSLVGFCILLLIITKRLIWTS